MDINFPICCVVKLHSFCSDRNCRISSNFSNHKLSSHPKYSLLTFHHSSWLLLNFLILLHEGTFLFSTNFAVHSILSIFNDTMARLMSIIAEYFLKISQPISRLNGRLLAIRTVSYTHLDVYKRQVVFHALWYMEYLVLLHGKLSW